MDRIPARLYLLKVIDLVSLYSVFKNDLDRTDMKNESKRSDITNLTNM